MENDELDRMISGLAATGATRITDYTYLVHIGMIQAEKSQPQEAGNWQDKDNI